jgi:hypothetical protein
MELITLTVVLASTLYFVTLGPKLVKPVLHFFILNLIVGTLFVFGIALVIFI